MELVVMNGCRGRVRITLKNSLGGAWDEFLHAFRSTSGRLAPWPLFMRSCAMDCSICCQFPFRNCCVAHFEFSPAVETPTTVGSCRGCSAPLLIGAQIARIFLLQQPPPSATI